jgi:DNA repair protein RecN (Recombination protein N)
MRCSGLAPVAHRILSAMLESLYVKDFAIVDSAEIAFGPGMTAVTGETGAGKSLLVDALLLLGGGRGDVAMIRAGAERAELGATMDLTQRADLRDWLRGEELDEDGACQVRRVIRAEGNSRAWINGRPVTLAQLRALMGRLVEIHGQHEHQALLEPAHQLALLDAFGTYDAELIAMRSSAHAWREVGVHLKSLTHGEDASARIEWLDHQLAELDRDALAPDQLAELEQEHRRLANAEQLIRGSDALAERLDGDTEFAVVRSLARAQAEAAALAALDPRLANVAELVESAAIQVGEATDALARAQGSMEPEPGRLAEIEERIARLHELARKHRVPMADLCNCAEGLRSEREQLAQAGVTIATLAAQRERHAAAWQEAATRLSAARAAAAGRLGAKVGALMAELGMAGGRFEVELLAQGRDDPDPNGAERAEFLVSANPGQPPRALRKVASGGELSRISLAIEVATLGMDEVGTMVFDEVDSGIGGAIAEVVGRKLRRLGERRQVLCVTHLAQVAAQAHAHLRVTKSSKRGKTRVEIEVLDTAARRDEIARMIGGIRITPQTLAHADQMLDQVGPD